MTDEERRERERMRMRERRAALAKIPAPPCTSCGRERFGRVTADICHPCSTAKARAAAREAMKSRAKLAAKHTGRRTAYKFSGKSHAPYTRADDAARFLRPWGPMLKAGDGWQWGSLRLTDAEVIARATRKGWEAPEGLA